MKHFAIIVAGGKGNRMNSELPKQFIEIKGKPIIIYTLERFIEAISDIEIILVLPKEQITYWQKLQKKFLSELSDTTHKQLIRVVSGGESRFHSVLNGLSYIQEEGIVAIHDGVRPFVAIETIKTGFKIAKEKNAAIPVIPLVNSIRKISAKRTKSINRLDYSLVQTPQVFDVKLLKRAYLQTYCPDFTDDASVVEALGVKVSTFTGNIENIKITSPFDLKIATAILD